MNMFSYLRQAYSVYYSPEILRAPVEENNKIKAWVDQNGDGTPDAHGKKSLANYTDQRKRAEHWNLDRAIVDKKVAMSDVWPPSTMNNVLPSKKLLEQKNTNASEFLTKVYEKMILWFEKHGYTHADAVTHAGNFMREYSAQLQDLMASNVDGDILKSQLKHYAQEYRAWLKSGGDLHDKWWDSVGKGDVPDTDKMTESWVEIIPPNLDTNVQSQAQKDINFFPDSDSELDSVVKRYWSWIQEYHDFVRQNIGITPEDIEAERITDFHQSTIPIPSYDFDEVMKEVSFSTPEMIISSIPSWGSRSIEFVDESGVSDVLCMHTKSWDYVLKFPTGESILIDSNGDPENAKKEIAFIQEVAKTPIIRRLLMNGNEKFQTFRQKFEKQFPWQEIDTNPVLFTRRVLERIVSKIPDEGLTDPQKTLKDQLATLCTPDVSLSHIQEFLRNKRDQLTPMLHKAGLIPQDGVQKLFTEKLL